MAPKLVKTLSFLPHMSCPLQGRLLLAVAVPAWPLAAQLCSVLATRDEALFHYTKNSGGPRGAYQIHSIPDFSEAP